MTILLNDCYFSIQCEGYNSGRSCLFIRFSGCNLDCSWCDINHEDVRYSYTDEQFNAMCQSKLTRFALLTGGEPSINPESERVVRQLRINDFEIACESNGVEKCLSCLDFLTISPKREANYLIHPYNLVHAREFKYVVDQDFDFDILKRHNGASRQFLYLSPEFTHMEDNVIDIMSFIEDNPQWRLSLQTQKWIDIR